MSLSRVWNSNSRLMANDAAAATAGTSSCTAASHAGLPVRLATMEMTSQAMAPAMAAIRTLTMHLILRVNANSTIAWTNAPIANGMNSSFRAITPMSVKRSNWNDIGRLTICCVQFKLYAGLYRQSTHPVVSRKRNRRCFRHGIFSRYSR